MTSEVIWLSHLCGKNTGSWLQVSFMVMGVQWESWHVKAGLEVGTGGKLCFSLCLILLGNLLKINAKVWAHWWHMPKKQLKCNKTGQLWKAWHSSDFVQKILFYKNPLFLQVFRMSCVMVWAVFWKLRGRSNFGKSSW